MKKIIIAALLMASPAAAQVPAPADRDVIEAAAVCEQHVVVQRQKSPSPTDRLPPKFEAGWEHCSDIFAERDRRADAARSDAAKKRTLDLLKKLNRN